LWAPISFAVNDTGNEILLAMPVYVFCVKNDNKAKTPYCKKKTRGREKLIQTVGCYFVDDEEP